MKVSIDFSGLLLLAFIVLKLCHVIEWSWLWVLSPAWIPIAVVLGGTVIVCFAYFIIKLAKYIGEKL